MGGIRDARSGESFVRRTRSVPIRYVRRMTERDDRLEQGADSHVNVARRTT
jgi:hypothetical protein